MGDSVSLRTQAALRVALLRGSPDIGLTAEQIRQVALMLAVLEWRPPAKVITTLDDLQALPPWTIIHDDANDPLQRRPADGHGSEDGWYLGDELEAVILPITVIWEPTP